ncbi:MAG: TetR/AcrR family transcriptional regulator [Oscillospiraceae bacterium]|nr:TetR/AcrR family transcriptional regulator [Oscillospiraceae bacterium]
MKQSKPDKRELIYDALEELMCTVPFKEISVDSIAKKAGVGKGSVYYYFESKDEILSDVIERSYRRAIREYLNDIVYERSALGRIKQLFKSVIRKDFGDSRQNLIITLHLHDDLLLHYKLKSVAVQELSPILTVLLEQGVEEGSIKMDFPKESAEIIVSVLTVFLDNTIQESVSVKKKLRIFANVLETCLHTQKGSFDFLFDTLDEEYG